MFDFYDELIEIPEEYLQEAKQKGKMVRLDYKTQTYYENSVPMDKYAYVYVPYGYDETKQYKIIYYIHGVGGSAEKYLVLGGEENLLKRSIDNLIEKGNLEPVIIVAPTWYDNNDTFSNELTPEKIDIYVRMTRKFHKEVVNDLIPAVESVFHTYADKYDRVSLKATRDYRAVCGFSMGSINTWLLMAKEMDCFRTFGPMSANYASNLKPLQNEYDVETSVRELYEAVKNQGYTKNDFRIISSTGTLDADAQMKKQFEEMEKHPDVFDLSENGNCVYRVWKDGVHTSPYREQYTFNTLPKLFK